MQLHHASFGSLRASRSRLGNFAWQHPAIKMTTTSQPAAHSILYTVDRDDNPSTHVERLVALRSKSGGLALVTASLAEGLSFCFLRPDTNHKPAAHAVDLHSKFL